jgi:hypothetical protein
MTQPLCPTRLPALTRLILSVALVLLIGDARPIGQATITLERVSGTSGAAPPPVRGEVQAQGMSADGRFVLMRSFAPEHLGDPDLGRDVWVVRDRLNGTTSLPFPGFPGPGALSGGRTQAVIGAAGTHVAVADLTEGPIEVRRRDTGAVEWSDFAESITKLSLSADGQWLAFDGTYDGGDDRNIWIVDVADQDVDLVSRNENNEEGNRDSFYPALSGNGEWIAFLSNAFDLVDGDSNDGMADLFLANVATEAIVKIAPVGPQDAFDPPSDLLGLLPSINHDGNLLAFATVAPLDAADTNTSLDVYVYDVSAQTFACASCSLTNGTGNEAQFAALSSDGSAVTFGVGPAGSPLGFGVPDDVHRLDRSSGALIRLAQTLAPLASFPSADGCEIAFTSYADGLVTGDTNGVGDAFVASIAGCPGGVSDTDPPVIQCTPVTPDGLWHAANVNFSCTATDTGSGLANPGAHANFLLSTAVDPGQEDINAFANPTPLQICDTRGNCALAQMGGIMIDRRAPTVTVTTPAANAVFTQGAQVLANYACVDNGSGVASCAGPVASGQAIDTSALGTRNFVVTGTDQVGNSAPVSVSYTVVTPTSGPTIAGLILQVSAMPQFPGKQILIGMLQTAERNFQSGNEGVVRLWLGLARAYINSLRLARILTPPVATNLSSQIQAILNNL